jgi:glycosyltransferase involved in cell wall biosynthesis
MTNPFFSVVMATFNRGNRILPSIESVLQQGFSDFELLVVGDACTDNTEAVVNAVNDPRIIWRNLKRNSGGQSGPNNDGIGRARGKWICYIGHDDIWRPQHLGQFKQAIDADTAADFVVGGCIWHGPPDSDTNYVTGLFDTPEAAYHELFPPSSTGHRREVVERIGGWRAPRSIRAPADCDFMLRAVHAGFRFVSTGAITVHKFAAGHRYLSYLRPDCAEQAAMLAQIRRGDGAELARIIERSKQLGLFMTMRYPDFAKNKPGDHYKINRRNKGLNRPVLQDLTGTVRIQQSDDPRALDWHPRDAADARHRWSGPNPHPKILIPCTGERARISIEVVAHKAVPGIYSVSVSVDGTRVSHDLETRSDSSRWLVFETDLKPADETILTLHTPAMFRPDEIYGNEDLRRLGIPVADIIIEPL